MILKDVNYKRLGNGRYTVHIENSPTPCGIVYRQDRKWLIEGGERSYSTRLNATLALILLSPSQPVQAGARTDHLRQEGARTDNNGQSATEDGNQRQETAVWWQGRPFIDQALAKMPPFIGKFLEEVGKAYKRGEEKRGKVLMNR